MTTTTMIKMKPTLFVRDIASVDPTRIIYNELMRLCRDFERAGDTYLELNTGDEYFDDYPLSKAYIEASGYGGRDVILLF